MKELRTLPLEYPVEIPGTQRAWVTGILIQSDRPVAYMITSRIAGREIEEEWADADIEIDESERTLKIQLTSGDCP